MERKKTTVRKQTVSKKAVSEATAKSVMRTETAAVIDLAEKESKSTVAAPNEKSTKRDGCVKSSVLLQFGGQEWNTEKILSSAIEDYSQSHKGAEIKDIHVYVKPEEHAAYYVVNGEGSEDFKILL